MDDTRSMMSLYWDAKSITSETTMPDSCFHTPTGSFLDVSNSEIMQDDTEHESSSLTPAISELNLDDEKKEAAPDESHITSECAVTVRTQPVAPSRPPPIKLQKAASTQLDTISKSTEKKDWRRSFAKRLSFTKSKIMTSLSMNKHETKSRGDVLLSMRNSIRRLRSSSKHKGTVAPERKEPETIKDTLGSDCEYFNFDKGSMQQNSDVTNEVFEVTKETTPIKPRRQFPQDKYLTGSEEMLQKAYNSLNRKSQIQEDKSIFDLCSAVSYLFEVDPVQSSTPTKAPQFITECLNAFLEMNTNQIEEGLRLTNKHIGQYFDLFSENLDQMESVKKYRVEELLGSAGVCVITDVETRQRFVALKRRNPRNWISFTGFLQHIDKETEGFVDQTWVCYRADSITNMYLERDCFEPRFQESKDILDSLLQLLVLLHSQLIGECRQDIKPSNVLLISSNLSLICVFDQTNLASDHEHNGSLALNITCDEEMRATYQQSLMHLNTTVAAFLASPHNSYHLISASYPLDYLFFILLKLHRDVNVLLDSI